MVFKTIATDAFYVIVCNTFDSLSPIGGTACSECDIV